MKKTIIFKKFTWWILALCIVSVPFFYWARNHYMTTTDIGVVINGVKWATHNVNVPGTFTASLKTPGMFYQWDKKVGWSTTDPLVSFNGKTEWDNNVSNEVNNFELEEWDGIQDTILIEWKAENDPCPCGWRLPTTKELLSLLDTTKVISEEGSVYGINGRRYTDKKNGNMLFLPAVSYRSKNGFLFQTYCIGLYWSSTASENSGAYSLLIFENGNYILQGSSLGEGHSVRCVADE